MTTKRHALLDVLPACSEQPAPTHADPLPPTAHAPTHEATPTALREVLSLRPAQLAPLPLPTTLLLRTHAGQPLVVTSGRQTYAELVEAGVPVLTARGLVHLAIASENGRSSHEALATWLASGEPARGVTPVESVAYGGCCELETATADTWPLTRVLDAWGLTLHGLAVGDGPNSEVLV